MTAPDLLPEGQQERILHIQVGQIAGDEITLNANALRSAPLEIVGSGSGAAPGLVDAKAAFADLLQGVAKGDIRVAVDRRPLTEVAEVWDRADSAARTVFVP
ncbi:hypothetical protein ABTY20_31500 [Streptomyces sp. NPDC126497]|uniref:hypothetical protein n=1 Tax=Streptomyces sp. NPDC126497 TaxID=3155313 RepID=UPI0033330CBE